MIFTDRENYHGFLGLSMRMSRSGKIWGREALSCENAPLGNIADSRFGQFRLRSQHIADLFEPGADVVALFRRDGSSRKPALVRRFRRSKKTEWEWIARPVDGVAVNSADVIILRKEFERCERAWGLFDAGAAESGPKASTQAKRAAGPGAPPKHDWDAFAGAIARRVHDHGMPVSQGELVRDMMDWFAGREDFPPPDERTVRRKVSAIWRELNGSHP
ncbi:MAG: hypothetical protein WCJ41_00800 [Aestuariivirga sp.]|uniref:hypothetical protein n=1 Tax=Aestuariivirga sp. TaxID=2650926 RepID=UPI0030175E74